MQYKSSEVLPTKSRQKSTRKDRTTHQILKDKFGHLESEMSCNSPEFSKQKCRNWIENSPNMDITTSIDDVSLNIDSHPNYTELQKSDLSYVTNKEIPSFTRPYVQTEEYLEDHNLLLDRPMAFPGVPFSFALYNPQTKAFLTSNPSHLPQVFKPTAPTMSLKSESPQPFKQQCSLSIASDHPHAISKTGSVPLHGQHSPGKYSIGSNSKQISLPKSEEFDKNQADRLPSTHTGRIHELMEEKTAPKLWISTNISNEISPDIASKSVGIAKHRFASKSNSYQRSPLEMSQFESISLSPEPHQKVLSNEIHSSPICSNVSSSISPAQ